MRRISIFLLLTVMALSGCTYRQYVRTPYPRWGEEITVERSHVGPPLVLRVQHPPGPDPAPACLLIVHGMNEYSGRYAEIARYFGRRFIVAGFDLYAHGLSNPVLRQADHHLTAGEAVQEVGTAYLAQASLYDLEPMRQDFDAALRSVIELCDAQGMAGRPVFILSHSLGSLVAASYLIDRGQEPGVAARVRGIVMSGPAFSVSQLPGWRGWLANPLIDLSFYAEEHLLDRRGEPWPEALISQPTALVTAPLLNGLFEVLSWPGLRSLVTPTTPEWVVDYLTDWEEEKARHRADGWIIRRSLLRYVKAVEREIVRFRRRMGEFAIPYFLIYSGHDPITPAWGSQDFARVTLHKHADNQLLPLPELSHHEHLFSAPPLREELLRRIEQWLTKRLAAVQREEFP